MKNIKARAALVEVWFAIAVSAFGGVFVALGEAWENSARRRFRGERPKNIGAD